MNALQSRWTWFWRSNSEPKRHSWKLSDVNGHVYGVHVDAPTANWNTYEGYTLSVDMFMMSMLSTLKHTWRLYNVNGQVYDVNVDAPTANQNSQEVKTWRLYKVDGLVYDVVDWIGKAEMSRLEALAKHVMQGYSLALLQASKERTFDSPGLGCTTTP